MALVNVTEAEWDDAKRFFDENPSEVKYQKRFTETAKLAGKQEAHSFIKMNGEIFALNNTQHIVHEPDAGKGGFGRAKVAVSRGDDEHPGKVIVIKVEAKEDKMAGDRQALREVEQIMRESGYLLGRVERQVDLSKGDSGTIKAGEILDTDTKVFTAFEYRGNRELFTELFEKGAVSAPMKRVYALKTMMGLHALHRVGILHRDVKAENFMVNGEGKHLTVLPIDFDMSLKLPPGQTYFIEKNADGTPFKTGTFEYLAPEIKKEGKYSTASDVYALGKNLAHLRLPIAQKMIEADENKRISLPGAMREVADFMRTNYPDDSIVKKTLKEYDDFITQHPSQTIQFSKAVSVTPLNKDKVLKETDDEKVKQKLGSSKPKS